MRIATPNPNGSEPIMKDVVVGGGVRIRLEGTRYLSEATVLAVDEAQELATVKGVGFEAVVNKAAISDTTTPEQRSYQELF